MEEKYIDEKVGSYFIFGCDPRNPGKVDVSDGDRDIFTHIDIKIAEQIIEAQNRFREELYKIMGTS